MTKTFDDVIAAIDEYVDEHFEKTMQIQAPPYEISKELVIPMLKGLVEHLEQANGHQVDLRAALHIADKRKDFSKIAALMNTGLELMGVTVKPGWGKREKLSAVSIETLQAGIRKTGNDPEEGVTFHDGRYHVASVMDYR